MSNRSIQFSKAELAWHDEQTRQKAFFDCLTLVLASLMENDKIDVVEVYEDVVRWFDNMDDDKIIKAKQIEQIIFDKTGNRIR